MTDQPTRPTADPSEPLVPKIPPMTADAYARVVQLAREHIFAGGGLLADNCHDFEARIYETAYACFNLGPRERLRDEQLDARFSGKERTDIFTAIIRTETSLVRASFLLGALVGLQMSGGGR